jgi:hypothetical protein
MPASAKPSRRRSHNTPAARRLRRIRWKGLRLCSPSCSANLWELEAAGNPYLANQLRLCAVRAVSYDADSDVAVIALDSPRQLNAVEHRIIGPRYEQSVAVSTSYSAHVELDNFDRAIAVQIRSPPAQLRSKLTRLAAAGQRSARG